MPEIICHREIRNQPGDRIKDTCITNQVLFRRTYNRDLSIQFLRKLPSQTITIDQPVLVSENIDSNSRKERMAEVGVRTQTLTSGPCRTSSSMTIVEFLNMFHTLGNKYVTLPLMSMPTRAVVACSLKIGYSSSLLN